MPTKDQLRETLVSVKAGLEALRPRVSSHDEHLGTCNGDEDTPCDCGSFAPLDVVESLLMQIAAALATPDTLPSVADHPDIVKLTWKDGTPVTARMTGAPDDYRDAPSGVGPMAAEWQNKPHRLVYDLAGEVMRLRAALATPDTLPPVAVGDWVLLPGAAYLREVEKVHPDGSLFWTTDSDDMCELPDIRAIYRTPLWSRG